MSPVFAEGRTAVVTGAASGIGEAACRAFAGWGMNVVLADLGEEDLAAAKADISVSTETRI